MKSIGTLFGGFGGVDVGAVAAGLTPAWSIELDAAIAGVARANLGDHVQTANVLDCDPARFERVDVLHASPPCPNFSVANAGGGETALDIALARKVGEFVTVLRPRIFTLENVIAYRHSKSWRIVEDALQDAGYWLNVEHVNAADYGGLKLCPLHDTNYRVKNANIAASYYQHEIAPDIAAVFATMQPAAQAMHLAWDAVAHLVRAIRLDTAASVAVQGMQRKAQLSPVEKKISTGRVEELLMNVDMFVSGSMENIDANTALLLKTCLDAPLLKAKWYIISTRAKQITLQLILRCIQATEPTYQNITRLGKWSIPTGALGISGGDSCPLCHHEGVPQSRKRMIVRAVRGGFVPYLPETTTWVSWYAAIEDMLHTLPESQFAPWQMARLPELLASTLVAQNGYDGAVGVATEQDPAFTITANHNQLGLKAFLMQVQGQGGDGVRFADEPMQTITSNHGAAKYRAWLIGGDNTSNGITMRDDTQPALTVTTGGPKHPLRSLLSSGRIVAMTPRALARFQSFPDTYQLPDNARLAAKGIGNAVPPLLYQRIIAPLLEVPA